VSDDRGSRIERMLEQTARKVSGGGLHPLEILQRVQDAVERGVDDGVAPNDIVVGFQQADYARYEASFDRLSGEIGRLLDGIERSRGLRRIGDRRVRFERDDNADEGRPTVTTKFADTANLVPGAGAARVTRRITRQRGATLRLSDGRRIAVTHTPFAIGRGPSNDLVLPSLAVSRQHAVIENGPAGLVLRDTGSRNGLVVDGERVAHVRLVPGQRVHLGDFELTLEAGA
jgi:hypothetical protein